MDVERLRREACVEIENDWGLSLVCLRTSATLVSCVGDQIHNRMDRKRSPLRFRNMFFLLIMDSKREVRLKSAHFEQAGVLVRSMLLQSVMTTSRDKSTEEINTSK